MNFLKVASIMKPRGLKGETRIYLTTSFTDKRFKVGNRLYLYDHHTEERFPVTVASYQYDKDNVGIIRFNEIDNIEEIEHWHGAELHVEKKEDLPTGFFYFADLIGCAVHFDQKQIGHVIAIEEYAPYASLRVQLHESEKSILIPYIDEFIKETDAVNKIINVHSITGLL